jgi:hypothetical protein
MITVTEKARERLAEALGQGKAAFIRILVGRG